MGVPSCPDHQTPRNQAPRYQTPEYLTRSFSLPVTVWTGRMETLVRYLGVELIDTTTT